MNEAINVGVLVFDEVEVLSFAGPLEVFTAASRVWHRRHSGARGPFEVFTVAESDGDVQARGGLVLRPSFSFATAPAMDVLIVPGGSVALELTKPGAIEFIAERSARARITASVCTGAFLLAEAGLLEGKRATTQWDDLEDLETMYPNVTVERDARWVDEHPIYTSADVSAGMELSLHLVKRLAGEELALVTARQMGYPPGDGTSAVCRSD